MFRAVGVSAAVAVAQAAPALTALSGVRLRLTPGLAGVGTHQHVALTFDDGPDPASTPRFMEQLRDHGVRATFFLLGSMLHRAPGLGRDLAAGGHEIAVHGWHHGNLILRTPKAIISDLGRTKELIETVTGRSPRFFRPPYGVLSASALWAAARLDLRPVLWTSSGRDWTRSATRESVLHTLVGGLDPGGTVLLHDSDCTSAPGAWCTGLAALPGLLDECARQGLRVGPLAEHFAS